jgi:hypothetical protein
MFFDMGREEVRPVIFGDEIKIGDRSRVEGSEDGVFSRVANRGRRKSTDEISIIGSRPLQVRSR